MTRRRFLIAACAALVLALGMGTATAIWPMTSIAEGRVSVTPAPEVPTQVAPTPAAPTTFAVVGDSISARASRAGLDMTGGSWTTYASQSGAQFVDGGWAQSGAKLAEMQSSVTAVTADVLVILAGTNDLPGDLPIADRLVLVNEIAQKAGVERVILAAVPPLDANPALATEWNAALAHLAAQNAWTFVDPWNTVRTVEDTYEAPFSIDGMHPTPAAAEIAGTKLRAAIVAIPSLEA